MGNFFGLLPDELREKSDLHGVEIDSISARMAKLLYPQANIQNTGYEETFAKDYFDIVLGNVPFGDFKLIDKQNPEITAKNFNIHDHFLAKSLDQVKPGGVVTFITSSGTMDKESTATRRYLADHTELLGAIRLPNNAFKGIANTEVTSDIIFLQKRATPLNINKMSETEIAKAVPWVFTDNVSGIKNAVNGESFPINSYFKYNPNMVLGDFVIEQGTRMHGALIPTCKPFEGIELAEQLATAVQNIKPMKAIEPKANGYIGTFEVKQDIDELSDEQSKPPYNKPDRNFSYILGNQSTKGEGKIYFYESPLKVAEDIADSLSDLQKSRLTSLINIKDTTRALIDAQLNNQSDEIIRDLQAKLNEQYDRYSNKHGLINNQVSKRLFSEDASYPLLCALEVLDSDGNFKGKSDMFTKRTINPAIEITHADTAEEALIISMSERGQIDVGFMEKLTGKSEKDLFAELVGL